MARLLLVADDGELLNRWDVTTREDAASSFAFQLNTPFARTALVNEVRDELARHEGESRV